MGNRVPNRRNLGSHMRSTFLVGADIVPALQGCPKHPNRSPHWQRARWKLPAICVQRTRGHTGHGHIKCYWHLAVRCAEPGTLAHILSTLKTTLQRSRDQ